MRTAVKARNDRNGASRGGDEQGDAPEAGGISRAVDEGGTAPMPRAQIQDVRPDLSGNTRAAWCRSILLLIIGLGVVLFAYFDAIATAVHVWNVSTTYNHAFAILPIAGYLVWLRRDVLAVMVPMPSLWGPAILVVASLAWLVGRKTQTVVVQQFAVVTIIQATVLGLGHRRLSIVDLSGGHQPLFNEDSSVVVVYNGEIFDFPELSDELIGHGHTFRTRCDTEVIVHAWEQWGEACVERFRGQFAFALWDSNSETLFLARDRLGIKPLYYAELDDGTVVFGSEMKALLQHPGVPRTMDVTAVEDYFAYGYVPDPKSIYAAIRKLAPGHTLTYSRNSARRGPRAFWDVSFDAAVPADETAICDELIERLSEAVRIRLLADVPLGAFLSGGVDSSGIVALMAKNSSDPVDTCSIAFNVRGYDESAYASQIAERYATRHRVRAVDPDSFDLIDRLASFYDEPFADSSAMPTYRVCALAREQVTVALSGDGGDEVFAGYRRYRWHNYEEMVRSRVPAGMRRALFGTLGAAYPKIDWAPKPLRAKSTLEALARDTAEGFFHSVSVLNDALRGRLFSEAMHRDLQGYHAINVLRHHMDTASTDDHLSRVQYADFKTYLPRDILTKVDRASMATSLEVRVPILDHEFLGWAVSLPPGLKLRNREGKYIFKKALEPYVPDDVLYRPKMGFAVPLADWFRGPLRERVRELVSGEALADSGMFDMGYASTLVDQHQSAARDHSAALWALVMFDSFLRQVHGANAEPPRIAAASS